VDLEILTPEWAEPLLGPKRYKGIKGGRSSGKSHERAEAVVEAMVMDPDCSIVCIREIQKSLKFSAKRLIQQKIRKLGVAHMFTVLDTEIRRKSGTGVCIFQGMQDHTAESIKSLEGFDVAWVEEANSLSARSMELLLPTIRKENSEIWFTWNPDQPDDPVERFFREEVTDDLAVCVHVNYTDNPHVNGVIAYSKVVNDEAERHRRLNPDSFDHVWLGAYNKIAHCQVFRGKWREDQFEPQANWDAPLFGADWGFADDPTVLVQCYVHNGKLWIYRESHRHALELDDIATTWVREVPAVKGHTVRGDNSRPETVSHVNGREGLHVVSVEKWPGSVKDGIEHIRSYDEIVIHSQCASTLQEARLYSYKIDRRTKDVLPEIVDKHNHCWDAIRYALAPLIRAPELEVFE
jgi:phage terminase large subunit